MEVYHKEYNIDDKDNINELPEEPAVFGIFSIIHEVPVHCRYVGSTDNLRKSVREVFENPDSEGLKKEEERIKEYEPQVTEEGEYPEYKYVWPYDEVDE